MATTYFMYVYPQCDDGEVKQLRYKLNGSNHGEVAEDYYVGHPALPPSLPQVLNFGQLQYSSNYSLQRVAQLLKGELHINWRLVVRNAQYGSELGVAECRYNPTTRGMLIKQCPKYPLLDYSLVLTHFQLQSFKPLQFTVSICWKKN